LGQLIEAFPDGVTEPSPSTFLVFHIPAGDAPAGTDEASEFTWGGGIDLRSWEAVQEDDRLQVKLQWQAKVEMARSYTVFVHVLAEDGTLIAQLDRLPDGYLTSDWKPGEIVSDRFTIPLPGDLPAGRYLIQTGFYYLPTQERLGEPLVLGGVEIQ
jgi:hypothetical protein